MPRSALYKNIMRKKPNILLTDDEDTFRNIMAKELTRMGYNVVSCASGSETINTLHERDFDTKGAGKTTVKQRKCTSQEIDKRYWENPCTDW